MTVMPLDICLVSVLFVFPRAFYGFSHNEMSQPRAYYECECLTSEYSYIQIWIRHKIMVMITPTLSLDPDHDHIVIVVGRRGEC